MEKIKSKDGTPIAYEKSGSGPPLLLVYGNGDIYKTWKKHDIQTTLAKHCTVYLMERRGRGESGDNPSYNLNKEAEDIASIINLINENEPVTLLGHSGGAIYSLEAALKLNNLNKLILYEPPIQVDGQSLPVDDSLQHMKKLNESGDKNGLLVFFLENIAGLSHEEIDGLRKAPIWKEMEKAAGVLPREIDAVSRYKFNAERFDALSTPTLLLQGSESPPFYKAATQTLHNTLPNSLIVTLEGQQHEAMQTDPELFIEKVVSFIFRSN